MSMNPGATTAPDASSSRSASTDGPIATTRPPETPTSARTPGAPVPSTTVPPRMASSAVMTRSCLEEQLGLLRRRPGGGAPVDRQDDPGQVRGLVAGQVDDGVGGVVGLAVALQRRHVPGDRPDV